MWVSAVPDAGRHAVMCFFVLSGFLVAKIACETYAGRPAAFLLNRALRLYPLYFFSIAFGAMTLALFPARAFDLSGSFEWPHTPAQWLSQFFILGLNDTIIHLSPSSWSLNIELYFYLVIGLVTYRAAALNIMFLLAALLVGALALFRIIDLPFYMGSLGSAFTFFIGACTYFFASSHIRLSPILFYAAFTALVANMFITPLITRDALLRDVALVLSSALMAPLLLAARTLYKDKARLRWISEACGKISYPVFLLHWAVAVYLTFWFGKDSAAMFLATLAGSFALSCALLALIDPALERVRASIRRRPETIAVLD